MSPELHDKLIKAGFPKPDLSGIRYSKDNITYEDTPTLSELIEACGEGFALLGVQDGVWCAYDKWDITLAISNTETHAKSPEEAVALLYLKLNKPKNVCEIC